ncbi:MAG: DUF4116 domain-containing protein, partial [Elusimicrobiota bacterium]
LALAYSAYRHLKEQPNDPTFQKYKERLYDREWVMKLFETNYAAACVVEFLPPALLNDRELVKASLRYGRGYETLPASYYADRTFMMEMIGSDGRDSPVFPVHKLSPELLNDKELALKAVSVSSYHYRMFSDKIRSDKDVQCAAWVRIQKTQTDPAYKTQMMTDLGLPSEIGGKPIDAVCVR